MCEQVLRRREAREERELVLILLCRWPDDVESRRCLLFLLPWFVFVLVLLY